ncbi:MAG: hypothetical protein ACRD1X_02955 [Vicinamibacteria bacterium]
MMTDESVRTIFPVAIDYSQSLVAMIQTGRYDWVNSDITEKHFPVASGPAQVSIELVHFNRVMSTDDVLSELDRRGLRPATLPELLAFGEKYPEKQRKFPIIALGSVWRYWLGGCHAPYLWGNALVRCLFLFWLGRWRGRCCFAAVRK